MARVNLTTLTILLFCAWVSAAPVAESVIACGDVTKNLGPCLAYLKSPGAPGTPPGPCCNGVRNLNNAAKTTPDRQAACSCIKSTAARIPTINRARAEALPAGCGVNIPYKISTSTNCKNVK